MSSYTYESYESGNFKRNLMNELTEGIDALTEERNMTKDQQLTDYDRTIDKLFGDNQKLKEVRDKMIKESQEIEQILGKALGYPWFKDDLKNFPNATETDGVCVGDHTAWSLAMCVADLSIARACNPAVCLNIPPKEVLKVPKNVLSKNLGCLYLFLVG